MRALFIEHPAGVQEHRTTSTVRKIMLDFAVFHRAMLREDSSKQRSQRGFIPLSVAEFVEQLTLGGHGTDCEDTIECPGSRHDAQIFVEDDKRFADGINDRVCKRRGLLSVRELL